MRSGLSFLLFAGLFVAHPATAQTATPQPGPVIPSAGAVYAVPNPDFPTPPDRRYRAVFDVSETAEAPDEPNRGLNTVARFLNMHAQAGVPPSQLEAAVVVHGGAGKDLLNDSAYRARFGVANPNGPLLEALSEAGVRIILCGQTAASRDLPREQLAEPVEMALSAMTALVLLQDDDYRLIAF